MAAPRKSVFDDLAGAVSSQLTDIFGVTGTLARSGVYSFSVDGVIRKDVEMVDEYQQVVARVTTLRVTHADMNAEGVVPERGDTFTVDWVEYTLGKRLEDDGYNYTYEVTT